METEDNIMQKVGMREDNEKEAYESYTSRERRYSKQRFHRAVRRGKVRRVHTMKISKSTQL